jgi:hypothetical protein
MFNANFWWGGIPLIDGQFDCKKSVVSLSVIEFPVSSFGMVLVPIFFGEFDPGSGRTLAACLTHASRTMISSLLGGLVANG